MKIYLLGVFMGFTLFAQGQCYSVSSIPYSPDSYSGTTVSLDDNKFSSMIPIGFPFCFYGFVYDSLTIGSNGVVSFTSAYALGICQSGIGNFALPNLYANFCPKNCVMLPWQDLNPVSGGNITYSNVGNSPDRVFIISFDSIPLVGCTKYFKGQVKLFETSNIIETHIANKDTCVNWNNGKAVHGLHGKVLVIDSTTTPYTAWSDGVFIQGRNGQDNPWTAANEGKKFTPICDVCNWTFLKERESDFICSIKPNPFTNQTTIQTINTFKNATLTILNNYGQTVKQLENINGQKIVLFRDNLAPGFYSVLINQENKIILTDKLIILD